MRYQPYKPVPQAQLSLVPMPMQSYNPPLKSGYSTDRSEYFGYNEDGPHAALAAHHKLRLRHHDLNLKMRIRILRVFCRTAGTAIAIATATQEGLTLFNFIHTRNTIRGGRGPWAIGTELWTSILMFVASILTVIVGVIMIAAYLISIKAANNVSTVYTWLAVIVELGHVGLWISVAVTYRTGKNGLDLWGWACSTKAANIQHNFEGIVNFQKVCNRGESTWHLAIASAAVTVLTAIVWYLAHRREKAKEALKEHEETAI